MGYVIIMRRSILRIDLDKILSTEVIERNIRVGSGLEHAVLD